MNLVSLPTPGDNWSLGAAPDGDGNMWIAAWDNNLIWRYEIDSQSLSASFSPFGNPDSIMMAFDGSGLLWVIVSEAGDINELQVLSNGVLVHTYTPASTLVSAMLDIVYDGAGSMFVLSEGVDGNDASVFKVKTSDGTHTTLDLGSIGVNPFGTFPNLVFDPITTSVWFADSTGILYKVSTTTNTITTTFPNDTYTANLLGSLVYQAGSIWFADSVSSVYQIDPTTGALLNTYTGFQPNISMASDGANIWVLQFSDTTGLTYLSVILAGGKIFGPVTLSFPPFEFPIFIVWDGVRNMWITSAGLTGATFLLLAQLANADAIMLQQTNLPFLRLPFCLDCGACGCVTGVFT